MGRIKYFLFAGVVLFAVFFTACRSSKKLSQSQPPNGSIEVFNQYSEKYDFITDNAFDYDWLSAKVSIKLGDFSVNGQLRMHKDSVIWLSVTKFIEVARVKLTPDSVYFLNQLQNEYYVGDYSFLQKNFGLEMDFGILQALFTGNDIPVYGKLTYVAYRHLEDSSKVVFQFKDRPLFKGNKLKVEKQYLAVNLDNGRICFGAYTLSKQMEFESEYLKYTATERGYFPTEQEFIVKDYSANKMYGVELIFDKPALDKPLTFPFNIPNKAKPISF